MLARPIFAGQKNKGMAIMSEASFKAQKVGGKEGKENVTRDIQSLREAYKAAHPEGKSVSPRYANDILHMEQKIEEFTNQ